MLVAAVTLLRKGTTRPLWLGNVHGGLTSSRSHSVDPSFAIFRRLFATVIDSGQSSLVAPASVTFCVPIRCSHSGPPHQFKPRHAILLGPHVGGVVRP